MPPWRRTWMDPDCNDELDRRYENLSDEEKAEHELLDTALGGDGLPGGARAPDERGRVPRLPPTRRRQDLDRPPQVRPPADEDTGGGVKRRGGRTWVESILLFMAC